MLDQARIKDQVLRLSHATQLLYEISPGVLFRSLHPEIKLRFRINVRQVFVGRGVPQWDLPADIRYGRSPTAVNIDSPFLSASKAFYPPRQRRCAIYSGKITIGLEKCHVLADFANN